ncbi:exonuclease V a 5' deoxyribonuclease-domain-containing protein [Lenzites betulinus]|nr:exonuclease V a 5' deoxyribonuclease-domain-containing protein [Lenzites betulinus]
MSTTDEYDAFYSPIDHQDLVDIEAAAIAAYALREATPTPAPPFSQESQVESFTPDEFDLYDFSEFTADDFAHIDALVLAHTPDIPSTPNDPVHSTPAQPHTEGSGNDAGSRGSNRRTSWNGGPRVEIGFEGAPNANPRPRVKGSSRRTPFQQFRSWKGVLSVTDLVGPSWCEVQFDYGLRQKRYKKLEDRPTSFLTAEGKTIAVVQDVAAQNDRTVTRGKSIHKVLEREVQPETVAVEITTPEERWGLRLINMLASLQILTEVGYCREMPVFGVVQDQVVTGIIDEIARRPLDSTNWPESEQDIGSGGKAGTSIPNKRVAPSTPSKSTSKKHKHDSPSEQPQITAFFSPGPRPRTPIEPTPVQVEGPKYSLHLSDTKTRTRPSLPTDEDAFASRLQLMLYHRLLSNLLAPAAPSICAPAPLDFAALWQRVRVNPARRFSDGFLAQSGLGSPPSAETHPDSTSIHAASNAHMSSSSLSCLDDLVTAWMHAVQALNVSAVDTTLTLVYRLQPTRKRSGKRRKGPPTDISAQEAQALAAAVQASVSDVQGEGVDPDPDLTRAIFESLKDSLVSGRSADGDLGVVTNPFGVPISEAQESTTLEGEACLSDGTTDVLGVPHVLEQDPQLAWAQQDSLLSHLKESPAAQHAVADAAPSLVVDPPIIMVDIDGPTRDVPATSVDIGAPDEGEKTAPSSPARSGSDLVEVDEKMTVAELNVEARILGSKEFIADNVALDDYLSRILSWWHGQRKPEGVSVEFTRRCITCEYREGCEWREKKAQEAMEKYHAESPSQRANESPA